jgi:hypothetical protein
MTRRRVVGIAVLSASLLAGTGVTLATSTPVLRHAASSPEQLIERLLEALEAEDGGELRKLRVTESEYKRIILAGHVPEGAPFRTFPDEVSDYAWKTLDTKSLYYERHLLNHFGGRRWTVKTVDYDKGSARWAGYQALRQLRLRLAGDDTEVELATGSICEVEGHFKFVSFIRD